jgi:hypothetical protein
VYLILPIFISYRSMKSRNAHVLIVGSFLGVRPNHQPRTTLAKVQP